MNRTEKAHLPVAAITHEGKRGKNNEDRFAISSFRLNAAEGGHPVLLAVISDGVGGHRAGEVASEMTVNAISQFVEQSDGKDPQRILTQAVRNVSNQIYALGQTTTDFEGMGSTVACILIIGHHLYSATVGDSRIYLMRDGHTQQISTDHTWIQEALDAGLIKPADVANHPNQHVIRRYLGSPTPPNVDFRIRLIDKEDDISAENHQGMDLLKGDRLLLCSDGLSDLVSGQEMNDFISRQPLEQALKSLVDLANARGGHDNITISVIEIPANASIFEKKLTPHLISVLSMTLAGIAVFVLLGFAGWFLYQWISNQQSSIKTPTPSFILKPSDSPQKLTDNPLPTITLDPKFSFDTLLTPSPTQTSLFHHLSPGENTMTPWPTNVWTSTPSPTPQITDITQPAAAITPGDHL